jgi:hypothetical protein
VAFFLWLVLTPGAFGRESPTRLLFDFEEPTDVAAWSNLVLPDKKLAEPPAKIEFAADHATSGKHSLRITFNGGRWPTITTTNVPADWMPYWTFKADVTASRYCVVGFTALQERSQRGGGWDPTISRWTKTEFLKPGRNTVTALLHDSNNYSINTKLGKVVRFEIFMYQPHVGESIYVDNIRIMTAKESTLVVKSQFQVLGTDLVVSGVHELGKKLRSEWKPPESKSIVQIEDEFRTLLAKYKNSHPGAVLAILRDGEKGYDPNAPDRIYAGWRDAYWSSHGPDGMTVERAENLGKSTGHEVFMRHRSPLMRVNLSSIPTGSKILASRLVITRAHMHEGKDHRPNQPNMWVVEPCNRPWQEYEVNAFEYAHDRFWKAIGGMHWGDDPDFLPIYLAHGPSQGMVNWWDFTHAVRFWTDGRHPNHGFMLHGDAGDWFARAHSREAKDIQHRPAVLVIYEPK